MSSPSTCAGSGTLRSRQRHTPCATAADDIAELVRHLDLGPIHLTGQDISGPTTFRLAATHPELLRSLTAIETGLPGYGLETLADVTGGGAWHIGVLAAKGIPEMLLRGRERAFLTGYAVPSSSATPGAFDDGDIDEPVRCYSRQDGFSGAAGLYRSMLSEADEIRQLANPKLDVPTLAVGAGSGDFTAATMRHVATDVTTVALPGIGHYASMEAPGRLAEALLAFHSRIDGAASRNQ